MKILIATLVLTAPLFASAAEHDHASCPMHAAHMAARGDSAAGMGFSQEKTRHTFRLCADGGAIEVRANDAADAESVAAIRDHLRTIARSFAAGDFSRPAHIHDGLPDGAEIMKERRASIAYRYEKLERGGRVRIATTDAAALAAVHRFLRFQIEEHQTGDGKEVGERCR